MNLRRLLLLLLSGTLFLPIAVVLIVAMARLLAALSDPAGAATLDGVALAVGIVWALTVIALPIVLAIDTLLKEEPPLADQGEEQE